MRHASVAGDGTTPTRASRPSRTRRAAWAGRKKDTATMSKSGMWVDRGDQRDNQDREPEDSDDCQRGVDGSREPVVGTLGPGQSRRLVVR